MAMFDDTHQIQLETELRDSLEAFVLNSDYGQIITIVGKADSVVNGRCQLVAKDAKEAALDWPEDTRSVELVNEEYGMVLYWESSYYSVLLSQRKIELGQQQYQLIVKGNMPKHKLFDAWSVYQNIVTKVLSPF